MFKSIDNNYGDENMDNYGATIRELRKSKGLTIAELSEDIISLPFLSKYERGSSDISTSNFFKLIDRLNVSMLEFEIVYLQYDDKSNFSFMDKLKKCLGSDNKLALNNLIEEEKKYYIEDKNIRHKHNLIILEQHLNRVCGLKYDSNKIKSITNYLMIVDDWSYYEVSLFGNSIFFIPDDTVEFLLKSAIKKNLLFESLSNNKHELSLVLINGILKFIENNQLNKAKKIIRLTEEFLKNTTFYYEINKLKFLKGIVLIKSRNEKGLEMCEKSIEIMNLMGNYELANSHKIFLDNVIV